MKIKTRNLTTKPKSKYLLVFYYYYRTSRMHTSHNEEMLFQNYMVKAKSI